MHPVDLLVPVIVCYVLPTYVHAVTDVPCQVVSTATLLGAPINPPEINLSGFESPGTLQWKGTSVLYQNLCVFLTAFVSKHPSTNGLICFWMQPCHRFMCPGCKFTFSTQRGAWSHITHQFSVCTDLVPERIVFGAPAVGSEMGRPLARRGNTICHHLLLIFFNKQLSFVQ
jgi:hypothetical protein